MRVFTLLAGALTAVFLTTIPAEAADTPIIKVAVRRITRLASGASPGVKRIMSRLTRFVGRF